jgi:uncharacterized Zn-finger protein
MQCTDWHFDLSSLSTAYAITDRMTWYGAVLLWYRAALRTTDKHVNTMHAQLKPFRCGICDTAFGRKGVWKKHIQMVHEGQRKFECDVEGCNHSFGLKSDLKRHTQSVHLKQYVAHTGQFRNHTYCQNGYLRADIFCHRSVS